MVRNYQRKTNRSTDETVVSSAVTDVIENGLSLRKAAEKYNLKAGTLQHRVEKRRQQRASEASSEDAPINGVHLEHNEKHIFTLRQERQLVEYLIKCSKTNNNLTLSQLRKLAFELAKKLGRKYPKTWDDNESAGKEWAIAFRKRHADLSLAKPKNTKDPGSLAFHETSVADFLNKVTSVKTMQKITPDRIVNFDETSVRTVVPASEDLDDKSQRPGRQRVPAERRELVTITGIINALENYQNSLPNDFDDDRIARYLINATTSSDGHGKGNIPPSTCNIEARSHSTPIIVTPETVKLIPTEKTDYRPSKRKCSKPARIYPNSPKKQKVLENHCLKKQTTQEQQQQLAKKIVQNAQALSVISNKRKEQTSLKISKNQGNVHSDSCSLIDIQIKEPLGAGNDIFWQSGKVYNYSAHEKNVSDKQYLKEDDFVMVKNVTKKTVRHFVAHIVSKKKHDEFHVFRLEKNQFGAFIFPVDKTAESLISLSDIVFKLPTPQFIKGVDGSETNVIFDVDLETYNL